MSKGNYQIPFDRKGNQQHYPETWWVGEYPNHKAEGPNWRDNEPFEDTLTFDGFSRGRSAAYFHFKRADGTTVCVFLADIGRIMMRMVRGEVRGTFQFTKRGQNYGCQLVKEAA